MSRAGLVVKLLLDRGVAAPIKIARLVREKGEIRVSRALTRFAILNSFAGNQIPFDAVAVADACA